MDYSTYDISQYARSMESYVDTTSAIASSANTAVSAALGTMAGFCMVFAIVFSVLQIIAMWKIFTKAGKAGWKSLIPIYNTVILFKISRLSPWLILAYLTSFIPFVGWIIVLTINILQANGLSKSFGKSTGFTFGLVLLPSIFYLILGFDKSEYIEVTTKEEQI